uniref:Heat shock transcription factor 3 n=1 Tax=Nannospalax galili TaxID=1026970 RepID=A0A8C6R2L3_NANGA
MERFCKAVAPTFLHKLWALVEDTGFDYVIRWSKDGQSFEIVNEGTFSKEVLPKYFKHNNLSSFIRQLNMYGFRKVVALQNGQANQENKVYLEFQHPLFKRGGACLLENIKRKVSTRTNEKVRNYSQEFQKIMTEMQDLRNKQTNTDAKFEKMKRDYTNILLEITNLKKKYWDQQQLLTQVSILQFVFEVMTLKCGSYCRSLQLLPGASDSEYERPYFHIPEEKKEEAMHILKDGYAVIENKYKSLLDNISPVLEDDSNNVISSVDQPSGDDEKVSKVPSQDIPMNEDSLTFPLDLNTPFLEDKFIEELFEQKSKDMSLFLESSQNSDSVLTENKSDTNYNTSMSRDKMHIHYTDENMVDWSLLSKKEVDYDLDHASESLSLMKNEGKQSRLEASGKKDKYVAQYMEKAVLSILDETPRCDLEKKFQDSYDLPLDELKKPSNVLAALSDHNYIALNSPPQEDAATTIEKFAPQLCMDTSVDSSRFPLLVLNPASNMF